jgi:hypothetical protein
MSEQKFTPELINQLYSTVRFAYLIQNMFHSVPGKENLENLLDILNPSKPEEKQTDDSAAVMAYYESQMGRA